MKCDCCGKKKRLFESFAAVQAKSEQLNLCVECNDMAYKVRDDINDQNEEKYKLHLEQWKKRTMSPSKKFVEWQETFLTALEQKLNQSKK